MSVLLSEVFKHWSIEEDLQPINLLGGRVCCLSHSPAPWERSVSGFDTKCWGKVFIGKPVPPRMDTGLLLLYHPEYIGVMVITSKCNH